MDIASLRQNYSRHSLSEADVLPDPMDQFALWFKEATASQILEPNAMTLATVSPEGHPSARTVLLKQFDPNGFTFFTNYDSHKGKDLLINPHAALLFTWLELERQIRIAGKVEKISAEDSRLYFQSRPRESQIGAWASPQSRVIEGREMLQSLQNEAESKFAGMEKIPLPPHWGGYLLRPEFIEFWQGRPSRLHDRILFTRANGAWKIERLAP